MPTHITPSYVRTWLGSYLTFDGAELAHLEDQIFVEDADGEIITRTVDAQVVTFITRQDGSIMAINERFPRPWHTGETGTPFAITIRHQDGSLRLDIASATFTLVNRANSAKLIDSQTCQTAANGILSYRPIADQMATACLFLAQYTATLDTGYVLPLMLIEGEIESSL